MDRRVAKLLAKTVVVDCRAVCGRLAMTWDDGMDRHVAVFLAKMELL